MNETLLLLIRFLDFHRRKLPKPNQKGQLRVKIHDAAARYLVSTVGGRRYDNGLWILSRAETEALGLGRKS
ncbi:MAG: hypothetical protein V3S83_12415 [Gemmatimonadota bacterium]